MMGFLDGPKWKRRHDIAAAAEQILNLFEIIKLHVFTIQPPGTGLRGGLSQIIKNVHADVASRRNVGPHTVQDIRCNQCAAHIGYEFVEVAEEKDPVLDVGDFLLRMHKLNQSIADPPQPMHRQGGLAAPAA
ncbi:hypothetical protein ACH5RR_010031 [Cinchona calisaya]|uniref:Protein yippee-like n=1 Tax=Cinchona calisaya TaxID=153742 RepID=A0ABD3AGE9_9GENT